MKQTLQGFLILTCSFFFCFSLHAQTIDFEVANLSEGDVIHSQFSGGSCGVKFYLGSETSGIFPVLAEVGDQAGGAYFAFQGPMGNLCTGVNTQIDMPAPNQNVDCKFLTDDGVVSPNPMDLVIVWDNNTIQCSGYLLDIDGSESFTIEAYDVGGSLLASQVINTSTPGSGDGLATYWSFSNIGVIKKVIIGPSGGGNFGLAFDNFSTCSLQEEDCCGTGDNYQHNSDFELGQSGFTSTYTYQSTIAANSVIPKEYSIVNGPQLTSINPNWNITGATTCTPADRFMFVNGRTTQTTAKVVWKNTLVLPENKDYFFCAQLKNLPACAFDILPTVDIMAGPVVLTTATINVDPNNPCEWQLVSAPYSTQGNGGPVSVAFKIRLHETGIGDGNDLAIDDVTLREKSNSSIPTSFNTTIFPLPGTPYFYLQADHPKIDSDCEYAWSVCQINTATGECIPGTELTHSSWQNYPNFEFFYGYNGTNVYDPNSGPGLFSFENFYKITLTIKCPCSDLVSESQIVGGEPTHKIGNPTGGNDHILDRISIFPNPSTGNFTLELNEVAENAVDIQVLDAKGSEILDHQLTSGHKSWNIVMPQVSEGVYLIRMSSGDVVKTQKLVIKH